MEEHTKQFFERDILEYQAFVLQHQVFITFIGIGRGNVEHLVKVDQRLALAGIKLYKFLCVLFSVLILYQLQRFAERFFKTLSWYRLPDVVHRFKIEGLGCVFFVGGYKDHGLALKLAGYIQAVVTGHLDIQYAKIKIETLCFQQGI